jgi:hypothetical protein
LDEPREDGPRDDAVRRWEPWVRALIPREVDPPLVLLRLVAFRPERLLREELIELGELPLMERPPDL